MSIQQNKRKIINDPVYGFITIGSDLAFDIMEHPYFQRLRRIKQLGLTNFVFPGATHTRFQHAVGAMHLMAMAIDSLRSKGIEISHEEAEGAICAILMHDIGHGPFSHAMEHTLIQGITHEDISILMMHQLNNEFAGQLSTAIKIFKNEYPKRFLHQLVSSQLDMDRLDYLRRDSFFTGVTEGAVGSDRIIKMLHVVDDELVVEAKGIYSIEKFLIARRLMYWQVYLHKTVISAEKLLVLILNRAKFLTARGEQLFATPALQYFLKNNFGKEVLDNESYTELLVQFSNLDDNDFLSATKVWAMHPDRVLSHLSAALLNRNLFKINIQNIPFDEEQVRTIREICMNKLGYNEEEIAYFVFSDTISNNAYSSHDERIKILYNNGKILDIADASDILNLSVLATMVKKYFLCYPKGIV